MSTGTPPDDPATARRRQRLAYTAWIEQICRSDPGARTALRSGLRRDIDDVPRMHRLVTRWLPQGRAVSATEQRAYYAVAAMIADRPRSSLGTAAPAPDDDTAHEDTAPAGTDSEKSPGDSDSDGAASQKTTARYGDSLGMAFALAVTTGPGRDREMRESTAEARLNLLTRQSTNGLHRHLPAAVRYLRDLAVPVDWAQLLDDLIAWPAHSGRISRRWLQDYYRLRAADLRAKAEDGDRQELEESGLLHVPGPRAQSPDPSPTTTA
ncbi:MULTISPECIES: type I-E CRISPR-associated protein Cse2/CasB [Streptomyces]|uniref:Type I-E CRISPR-associated protein Cse2/CasB n=1 Tax=Streptomyces xinghaiensis TaxID=1038928 RepID=A0A3M8F9G7_9ACTN|nr:MULTISPECIES: type I-E CRISPR-associated protein Cse2/CasB [Streptomyces]OFA33987.1 type I-E CRISPR-associated protein Cse2/CasB [Streptomyces fradiae]PQM23189.1 type I-E CRISPR-associated protein Cse2/CasB [Streptomyces xinghaiensis]RKM94749.1 type I-E CRISPR-associated protein Cse2/CasB [Streptomyces xinghaiensis]RNC74809.1 type I-E CRISPR-associated protein Cse2/CasB [Streptomyces xinghaiensis]